MKYDLRNPKSAGIVMIMLSPGLGLLALDGASPLSGQYNDILLGIGSTLTVGAIEILLLSATRSFRKRGMNG